MRSHRCVTVQRRFLDDSHQETTRPDGIGQRSVSPRLKWLPFETARSPAFAAYVAMRRCRCRNLRSRRRSARCRWKQKESRVGSQHRSGSVQVVATPSDYIWAGVAGFVIGGSLVGVVVELWQTFTRSYAWYGQAAGIAVAGLWILTAWWLGMGSWRRTAWGCQLDTAQNRCPRHDDRCGQVAAPARNT